MQKKRQDEHHVRPAVPMPQDGENTWEGHLYCTRSQVHDCEPPQSIRQSHLPRSSPNAGNVLKKNGTAPERRSDAPCGGIETRHNLRTFGLETERNCRWTSAARARTAKQSTERRIACVAASRQRASMLIWRMRPACHDDRSSPTDTTTIDAQRTSTARHCPQIKLAVKRIFSAPHFVGRSHLHKRARSVPRALYLARSSERSMNGDEGRYAFLTQRREDAKQRE
jgi:hypothetical protein